MFVTWDKQGRFTVSRRNMGVFNCVGELLDVIVPFHPCQGGEGCALHGCARRRLGFKCKYFLYNIQKSLIIII